MTSNLNFLLTKAHEGQKATLRTHSTTRYPIPDAVITATSVPFGIGLPLSAAAFRRRLAPMKNQLIEYCEYNIWANNRMFDAVMTMTDDAHKQEIVSSFPTIYDTWLHIWSGQYVWMQRLKDDNISERPSKNFKGTMQELRDGLQASAQEWLEYVQGASEDTLTGSFTIEGRSGNTVSFVRKNIVMQVMNHGTYHRGQLVTMMRQAGATEIPSTDYMRYSAGE